MPETVVISLRALSRWDEYAQPSAEQLRLTWDIIQRLKTIRGKKSTPPEEARHSKYWMHVPKEATVKAGEMAFDDAGIKRPEAVGVATEE